MAGTKLENVFLEVYEGNGIYSKPIKRTLMYTVDNRIKYKLEDSHIICMIDGKYVLAKVTLNEKLEAYGKVELGSILIDGSLVDSLNIKVKTSLDRFNSITTLLDIINIYLKVSNNKNKFDKFNTFIRLPYTSCDEDCDEDKTIEEVDLEVVIKPTTIKEKYRRAEYTGLDLDILLKYEKDNKNVMIVLDAFLRDTNLFAITNAVCLEINTGLDSKPRKYYTLNRKMDIVCRYRKDDLNTVYIQEDGVGVIGDVKLVNLQAVCKGYAPLETHVYNIKYFTESINFQYDKPFNGKNLLYKINYKYPEIKHKPKIKKHRYIHLEYLAELYLNSEEIESVYLSIKTDRKGFIERKGFAEYRNYIITDKESTDIAGTLVMETPNGVKRFYVKELKQTKAVVEIKLNGAADSNNNFERALISVPGTLNIKSGDLIYTSFKGYKKVLEVKGIESEGEISDISFIAKLDLTNLKSLNNINLSTNLELYKTVPIRLNKSQKLRVEVEKVSLSSAIESAVENRGTEFKYNARVNNTELDSDIYIYYNSTDADGCSDTNTDTEYITMIYDFGNTKIKFKLIPKSTIQQNNGLIWN